MSLLNERLEELGETTPFSYYEWVDAAMHLGDAAETLLPAVEAMCATGLWRPKRAAASTLILAKPRGEVAGGE